MIIANGRIRIALVVVSTLTATPLYAQAPVPVVQNAINSIAQNNLQQHINVLASDSLEGREAGSRGGRAAANYIVEQLRKIGMAPAGVNGEFFQPFGGAADYRNILTVIPGSDPVLRNEYVVIGGHYDHVGYGNATNSFGPFGQIHNGADDNGSGCATLLELMRAIKTAGYQPRRSILFAFWDGEEKNLLGSKHFVTAPVVPLQQIKMVLNVDMVGRLTDERMEILGTRTAVGLRRFVSRRNDQKINIDFNWDIVGDSDHYPFVQRQIPFVMPFTDKHPDYHRPSDDPDKINFDGMQRVGRLVLRLLASFADMAAIPTYRARCRVESEGTRRGFERILPPVAPRLGVQTDPADAGVIVRTVVPNTPAANAGIRQGDQIVQVAGLPVTTETFRPIVQAAPTPTNIQIVRNGQTNTVEVRLDGTPRRIGIAWRTDAAEPGTMTLTRVIPGSSAGVGGLEVGDRIYALNGEPTTTDEKFMADIKDQTELRFDVERKGRLRSVVVKPPPQMAP